MDPVNRVVSGSMQGKSAHTLKLAKSHPSGYVCTETLLMNTHIFIAFLVPFSYRLHRNDIAFSPAFSLISVRTSRRGFSVRAREVKIPPTKAAAKKTPEKSKKMPEKSKKEFVWSDDESDLLLNVAND